MASRNSWKIRIVIGLAIVAFAFFKKCANTEENPYTGREQVIALDPQEEIALGVQSAPQMAQQHGGLYRDERLQAYVDMVGNKLVRNTFNLKPIIWDPCLHVSSSTTCISKLRDDKHRN